MKLFMPIILGGGKFDSDKQFPNIKKSQPRLVECYELEAFFEDGGQLIINGEKYPIKGGNILLAKPGDIRHSVLPVRCDFFHFTNIPKELEKRLSALPSVFEVEDFDGIEEEFAKIFKHYCSADELDNIAASAELLLLIKRLFAMGSQENSIAAKAKRFIYTNYAEEITVERIARCCNVSASYLHKVYLKVYGIGPAQALLNRRIHKAKEQIINTSLPLSEICTLCGFNSQSYFSDCFKRKTGVTPSEFRRNSSYMGIE